jgi:hypothetical protein
MLCDVRSSKNMDEDNSELWPQADVRELGFQHITDRDAQILPMLMQKKLKKRVRRIRVKQKETVVSASVTA